MYTHIVFGIAFASDQMEMTQFISECGVFQTMCKINPSHGVLGHYMVAC